VLQASAVEQHCVNSDNSSNNSDNLSKSYTVNRQTRIETFNYALMPMTFWRHSDAMTRNPKHRPSDRWRKLRPTRSIVGDTVLHQSATKLKKTYSSEFGALLWRHLTPLRKTAIWVQNYNSSDAQSPKTFKKIYFLYDF